MLPTNSLSRTASWVIVELATGRAVMETFNPAVAAAANPSKARAVPILEYLQTLNARAKAGQE